MLYIIGGDLKEGKASELQQWIEENEKDLADSAPQGWTYRGHYFTVHNIGPFDAAVMWEFDNYGDLDTAREHDDEVHESLIAEAQDFFLAGSGQSILLREASDTRVID